MVRRQTTPSGIAGDVRTSAMFNTALASGPGRTARAENGHDKPDGAVRGHLTLTSVTLSGMGMTATIEPAKPAPTILAPKRPWLALWHSVPTQ